MSCAITDKINDIVLKFNAICGVTTIAPTDLCYEGSLITYIYNTLSALPLNDYPLPDPPDEDIACADNGCGVYVATVLRPRFPPDPVLGICDSEVLNDIYDWVAGIQLWGKFYQYQVGGHGPGHCWDYLCGKGVAEFVGIFPRDATTIFSMDSPSCTGSPTYSSLEFIVTDSCASISSAPAAAVWNSQLIVGIGTAEANANQVTACTWYGGYYVNTTDNCIDSAWGIVPYPILGIPALVGSCP